MQHFRDIEIAGTAHERGVSHGRQLRGEIDAALGFYSDIFKLPETTVLEQAAYFQRLIEDFNPDYLTEINGIAEGAEQDPLWIVALNARTEILGINKQAPSNECTSMCFSKAPVLGQTWDWGQPLEQLCAVMRIQREDGHVIRMLTEPGIIGKIGMNNAGLGVCLNILTLGEKLDGVPIHVMLRAILDCASTAQAARMIDSAPNGKSSNVIVADQTGACFDREFAGTKTLTPETYGGDLIHTNHYLCEAINEDDDPLFDNSRTRLATAARLVTGATDHNAETMMTILSDRSSVDFPIYRPYVPDDSVKDLGTVATIIMDLDAREMHVRKGTATDNPFIPYSVT